MKREELKQILSNKNQLDYLISNNILSIDLIINELNKEYNSKYAENLAYLLENHLISSDKVSNITNPKYILYLAYHNVKNAPIEKLADAIIATNNAEYIYHFARDAKKAPVKKLAAAVVASGNAEFISSFISLNGIIKNVPLDILIKGLIKTKNVPYIYDIICNFDFCNFTVKNINNIINEILVIDKTLIPDILKNIDNIPHYINAGSIVFLNQLLTLTNTEHLKTINEIYQKLIDKALESEKNKEYQDLGIIQEYTTHHLLLIILNNRLEKKKEDLYSDFCNEYENHYFMTLERKKAKYQKYFSQIEE